MNFTQCRPSTRRFPYLSRLLVRFIRQDHSRTYKNVVITENILLIPHVYDSITCYAALVTERDVTSLLDDRLLRSISMATALCPQEQLLEHSLPLLLNADEKNVAMTQSVQTLLSHLSPLLIRTHSDVQQCAFALLKRSVPVFVLI